jgi:hypothetical protein
MELYDYIRNIKGIDYEEKIKEAIRIVRNKLNGLDIKQTCLIYASLVYDTLREMGITARIASTEKLDCYLHYFVMVLDKNKYYVIDLTYGQFMSNKLSNLITDGYMLMSDEDFLLYEQVISNKNLNYTLDDFYFGVFKQRSI